MSRPHGFKDSGNYLDKKTPRTWTRLRNVILQDPTPFSFTIFFQDTGTVPEATETIIHQSDHVAVFQVVRASFKERYKWTLSDGERNFNVAVHDDEFVRKVEGGQLSFRRGDGLKVHVETVSRKTDKGIDTEYKILKVLEVIKEAPQLNLPGT